MFGTRKNDTINDINSLDYKYYDLNCGLSRKLNRNLFRPLNIATLLWIFCATSYKSLLPLNFPKCTKHIQNIYLSKRTKYV